MVSTVHPALRPFPSVPVRIGGITAEWGDGLTKDESEIQNE